MASKTDLLLIFTMCSIWGGNYFAIKSSLDYVDPVTLSLLRAFFGGLAVLAFSGSGVKSLRLSDLGWLSVIGLFNVSFFLIALNQGLTTVGSSVAATLVYTQPVLVVALSPLVGEGLTRFKVAGVAAAFFGVVVVFFPDLSTSKLALGDLFELAASFSWAVSILLFKKWRTQLNSYVVTGVQNLMGALFIAPFLALGGVFVDPAPAFWSYLAYNVLLASALAYLIYFRVLSRMSASEFSSYLFMVPVLTTVFGSILGLKIPPWNELLGTALVAAGILTVNASTLLFRTRKVAVNVQPGEGTS
jgi:O-acetylserine/cysteine efflux transporter